MAHITKPSTPRFSVGVALDGVGWHPAAWREAGAAPERVFSAPYWGELAALAESAGLDYLTLVDALRVQEQPAPALRQETQLPPRPNPAVVTGRLDAALIASWIAPRTSHIGLIPTVTTTHTEPFHIATGLQTLDHVSLGRAGWQLRVSAGAAEAAAFGRKPAPDLHPELIAAGATDPALQELFDEAADVATVARQLWDSWEDGAIIRDTATGRFLDRERVHHIDFASERFSVRGPSIVPRSPQGQLPIVLLAHDTQGYELAARAADVVFVTPQLDPTSRRGISAASSVQRIVTEVRAQELHADRAELGLEPLKIVADLVVALNSSEESAAARLARLDGLGIPLASDTYLAAGGPTQLADLIDGWRAQGIDGVRLRPLSNQLDLPAIGAQLLPELRRRGLNVGAKQHPGTLRQRFGLSPAVNRYESKRLAAAATKKEHAA